MFRLLLLVLLFAALDLSSAWAERRVALVMGADDYEFVRPLKNAVNDARSVATALKGLGFKVFLEPDRDLKRMRRALDDFREDAAGADVALVFFAGHGVEVAGENRLLPVDAKADTLRGLKNTTLALEEVSTAVAEIGKVGLIMLDACRNDPFGAAGQDSRGGVSIAPEVVKTARPGLGRVGRAENILFAFAAAPGETAADGEGSNSPFSAALAEYLDTDGLEIRSVLTLVQQEVYDLSRGAQLPYVEDGLPRFFFAGTESKGLPERERLLLAMADVTDDLRREVEQITAERDMPLAPLYAVYLSMNRDNVDREELHHRLLAAADSIREEMNRQRAFTQQDDRVIELRKQAQDQFMKGAFETADALLEDAARLDAEVRSRAASAAAPRVDSLAEIYVQRAEYRRVQLRHADALRWLEEARRLYADLDAAQIPVEMRGRQVETELAIFDVQMVLGDVAGAAAAAESAASLATRLAAEAPAYADASRLLAQAQTRRGRYLKADGVPELARDAFEQALATTLSFHGDDRERAVAAAHLELGDVLFDLDRLDDALSHYSAAHRLHDAELTKAADPATRRRAIVTAERIANVQVRRGNVAEARVVYSGLLSRLKALADETPEDLDLAQNVSALHDRLGGALLALGLPGDALAEFRASLAIRERLAALDRENLPRIRGIAVSHQLIGDALTATGDLHGAVESYRSSVDFGEELALHDASNGQWQKELTIYKERLGEAEHARGEIPSTLKIMMENVAMLKELSSLKPDDPALFSRLVGALIRLGDYSVPAGDLDGALVAYEEARERLMGKVPPASPEGVRQLGAVLGKIAYLQQVRGDDAAAVDFYRQALAELSRADRSDDALQWSRAMILFELAELGDDRSANLREAASIARTLRGANALPDDDMLMADIIERAAATAESGEN